MIGSYVINKENLCLFNSSYFSLLGYCKLECLVSKDGMLDDGKGYKVPNTWYPMNLHTAESFKSCALLQKLNTACSQINESVKERKNCLNC